MWLNHTINYGVYTDSNEHFNHDTWTDDNRVSPYLVK
jgi:hypothetical protein